MKISNIKLKLNEKESKLFEIASKKSGIKNGYMKIVKKSLDARDKNDIFYVYSVEIDDKPIKCEVETIGEYSYPERVAIVGFGPAGIFSALRLARAGFKPYIIERGKSVEDRQKDNENFFTNRILNTESNIQYGEGGAGTFSDGKLNTGVKSEFHDYVLNEFVCHGAPSEITYEAKPHIGSDILPKVVKSIREEIVSLGGEIHFETKLVDIEIIGDKITSIITESKGKREKIDVSEVILGIGHSSRDTYKMLYSKGVFMEKKDCAIGFRVEHLQDRINKAQFGKDIGITADYKLVSSKAERGVFSFCMCPGGVVVPATSIEKAVVTNGMSEYLRDKENANSAIICQLNSKDYGDGVLSGIDLIEGIEKKAFEVGGGNYSAPCQNVVDFMKERKSTAFGEVKPSYALSTSFATMESVLPSFICKNIRIAMGDFNNKIRGFSESGVITAPETRTSSPVRIVREKELNAIGIINLYPVGEVGYAGGIMSSSIDGIKVAEKIKNKYIK